MAENIIGDTISREGRRVEFGDVTRIDCPSCNPTGTREDRKLYIRSNIQNSVTLECQTCAYTEHKPATDIPEAMGDLRDIKGRPVRKNSGNP